MLTNHPIPMDSDDMDYNEHYKTLQKELATLQQAVRSAGLPIILLFDGWSGAGKGRMIGKVIAELDPRGYQVHSYVAPDTNEVRYPTLWRYWRDIPPRGEISILDRSWYRDLFQGNEFEEDEVSAINTFERQLCDDGYLVLKFFLHIGQKEQRQRLTALADKKSTAWRVNKGDWAQNRKYETYFDHFNGALSATSPQWAPWHIIHNEDKDQGVAEVLEIIHHAITESIANGAPRSHGLDGFSPPLRTMPLLKEVNPAPTVTDQDFSAEIRAERKKIQKLHSKLYRKKIPVVIGFEGWDAAGKGGAIRRLSWALDPRGFDVVPIASPTKEELAHHYLWRFWTQLPKDGHVHIFDRTWYGRLMVERIEGLTPPERWQMGYDEINEFEAELHRWGAVVLKFWVHIDQETQLARFTDRQNTPEKQYKITDEDWRNRAKWGDYELAVNELLQKTSTEYAPWHIIEGNDKKFARLKVLQIVRRALEEKLEET